MNKIINENESVCNTSNSENKNENGKREKRLRKRLSKSERYVEERNELIRELEDKIGLTEDKRNVLLYDLDDNMILKDYLKDKIPDIRRLYKCGSWNYFVKQHTKEGVRISEISLLKSIMKAERYEITNRRKITERDNIKKVYIELYFNKK